MDRLPNTIEYIPGFNGYHQSEAEHGALPKYQNSPQKPPMGLYAEQINGSAFTTAREQTKLTWCYRTRPSAAHEPFVEYNHPSWLSPPFNTISQAPNQYRWSPDKPSSLSTNFIDSIKTLAGYGSPQSLQGASTSTFIATKSMSDDNTYFSNNDGELLIVLQEGDILVTTELGLLQATTDNNNSDIIVIPRGIRFKVDLISTQARGYICENFGQPLQLPELGPIGANGLAHSRHFLYPKAYYEHNKISNSTYKWLCKYQGKLWQTKLDYSPCNVVAWHGNFAPYKYNLNLFNTINTVSYDHPDPSIFTVLTSPSGLPGVANIDFVIFPPRWMVAEKTFRPPYFHKNIMSEFMGLIRGIYDAKQDGFLPGGASLHNRMCGHGPDYDTVIAAEEANLAPQKYKDTLAFMFESNMAWDVTEYALNTELLQKDYYKCWQKIPARFKS